MQIQLRQPDYVASPGFLHEKKDGEFQKWYAGLNYPKLPVVTDNGGTIAQNLNISVYPSWALIGKDGDVQRIVQRQHQRSAGIGVNPQPECRFGQFETFVSTNPTLRKRIQQS
ncbi:hypothetical protein [Neisseria gonorrhoeae]|uniref:hypothetical protein n=1 Tax=Neisseria gonorrhoeae TaxID=485 RepID=UPI00272BE3A9|nr:hypothetical protein [Neisseria gonorrhoeae]WLF12939.1 hypothetical protein Q6379_09590 [Neisseria gonorrhoeae]